MKSSTQESQESSAAQDRRVDVIVSETSEGRRQVVLRDLSYGPGIGWYAQKTIRLDPEQVDALMRSLCCAKQGCRSGRHGDGTLHGVPEPQGMALPQNAPASPGQGARQAQIIQMTQIHRA